MSALIIFIKNPEKGKVKTRLAKTIGDDRALRIYKKLMRHTREVAQSVQAVRFLFYSEWINEEDDWLVADFQKYLQPNGDLGDRMRFAFQTALANNDKAIIVGSDCPTLSPEVINQAITQLDTHDYIIGPTYDGGYYLLGMKQFEPSLFENIDWSTEVVFQQTTDQMKALDQTFGTLPMLSDVDYEEDWEKWGWEVE